MEGSTVLDPMGGPLSNNNDVSFLEDQAWVDSCFSGDSEILENNWDSFKIALQEVGTSHLVHIPASEMNYLASPEVGRTDDSVSSDDGEEIGEISDSGMVLDKITKSNSKTTRNSVYPFRPNYNEYLQENDTSDIGLDLEFFDFSSDTLAEDIFKVWDLGIPAEEEDELVSNDFEALKDLKGGSLDDIITGFSDLSLDKQSN